MRIAVIGAGIGGLYAVYKFSRMGLEVRCFESDIEVGGTWLRNCYPGARCDYDAFNYSYWFDESLRKSWKWSCRFPSQPEILLYLKHVADVYDLRKHITFQCSVKSLYFDPSRQTWSINTAHGLEWANVVVAAPGGLSSEVTPTFPGISAFHGPVFHTSRWPRDGIDLTGKRVAVIGTGCSGVQVVPALAKQALEVIVLQRTAPFLSVATNVSLSEDDHESFNSNFESLRSIAFTKHPLGVTEALEPAMTWKLSAAEREALFQQAWVKGGFSPYSCFGDTLVSERANEIVQDLFRTQMQALVHNPDTWETIRPSGYYVGTKRPVIDGGGYLEALNLPNVRVVDIKKHPIHDFLAKAIVTSDLRCHDVDMIVLATGFDFATGTLSKLDIRSGDASLADQWAREGPSSYFGVATHNFPNLFTVGGPFSPATWGGVFRTTEYLVDYIARVVQHMLQQGYTRVEVDPGVEAKYRRFAERTNNLTLYPKTPSYYTGANVPGKSPTLFLYLKGFPAFVREVEAAGLTGFHFSK